MVSHLATRISLHSLSLLLLFSPTSLAATNLIPHKPPARLLARAPPTSSFRDFSAIVVAAQCRPGEFTCNAGCMPQRAECCPDGLGYCKQGYACVVDGCCPIGHTCGDEVTCDLGEVPCGEKLCMPEGAVCCPEGGYCHAGEECFQNGFKQYCQKADGNGSTTTGRTSTGSIAETTTTTVRGQSTASSLALSTNTNVEETFASTTAETRTEAPTSASTLPQDTSSERVIKCVTCNDDHFVRFSLFFFSSRISNDDFN
ncbi:hypothetical protein A9Z42_0030300 [Trichoderma parareesei]|uniref:SSCRP protein n=1 Tax=Trichoderma parareesei TaxID=858221 RepID=A0A2H2Z8Z0_TRIPA|nr:hypothetical protein A9Z42_0030300 [Trichoderma parareesei]